MKNLPAYMQNICNVISFASKDLYEGKSKSKGTF